MCTHVLRLFCCWIVTTCHTWRALNSLLLTYLLTHTGSLNTDIVSDCLADRYCCCHLPSLFCQVLVRGLVSSSRWISWPPKVCYAMSISRLSCAKAEKVKGKGNPCSNMSIGSLADPSRRQSDIVYDIVMLLLSVRPVVILPARERERERERELAVTLSLYLSLSLYSSMNGHIGNQFIIMLIAKHIFNDFY